MKTLNIPKSILALLLFTIYFSRAMSANDVDTLVLNLGLSDPGTTKRIQGNQKYDLIILENLVNGLAYSIEIQKEHSLLPKLEFDQLFAKADRSIPGPCPEINSAMENLKDYQKDIDNITRNEKNLAVLINDLNVKQNSFVCVDPAVLADVKFWLEGTKRNYYEKISIETGKTVTIIIRRGTLEWKFIYEGDTPGKWVTTYGFGFTTNALRGPSFFTKQMTDTSVFEILKSRGPKAFDLSYVPAVFFTFFPSKRQSKCWNHSLTGGLGFDLQAPVIYFGYNGLYWHNIGFSAGLAFQQQNVLRDQFEENENVSMFMDTGQLHDKVYRPNLFISIHFRLDKNPFNKEEK